MPAEAGIYDRLDTKGLAGLAQYILPNAIQGRQLQSMQQQQGMQDIQDAQTTRDIYSQAGEDERVAKLNAAGLYKQGQVETTAQAGRQKATLDSDTAKAAWKREKFGELHANPTHDGFVQFFKEGVQKRVFTPEEALRGMAELPNDEAAIKDFLLDKSMTASERVKRDAERVKAVETGEQKAADREEKARLDKQRSEDRMAELQLRIDDRKTASAERAALARELASMRGDATRAAAEAKAEPKKAAEENLKTQQSISSQQVLDQAELLFNHPGRKIGTGATSFLSNIPGTDAKDFQANLDTFKAQTFIPLVSALKGMGALSDAEGRKLSDSIGALNPQMSTKAFEESLRLATKLLYDKAAAAGLNVSAPAFINSGAAGKVTPAAGGEEHWERRDGKLVRVK